MSTPDAPSALADERRVLLARKHIAKYASHPEAIKRLRVHNFWNRVQAGLDAMAASRELGDLLEIRAAGEIKGDINARSFVYQGAVISVFLAREHVLSRTQGRSTVKADPQNPRPPYWRETDDTDTTNEESTADATQE